MEYKLEKGDLHEDYKQCSEENRRCNMSDESNVDEEILNETEIKSKEFKSWNDAYEMYKKYGRRKGFGVRLHNIGRNKEKQITWRHFVCSSEGFRDKKYQENPDRKREQRNLTRSGCKASMRVQFNQERSLWFVSRFEDNHNHPLVGFNYTCFMRTHRSLTDADIAQVNSMRAAGIQPSQIMGCMVGQSGNFDNVGFIEKDLYNLLEKQRRFVDNDAMAVLSYLRGKAESDPLIFMRYKVDDEGRLQHLFWADGISRLDYESFGDVMGFDATYKKNKYNKPLVIFSGLNNHKQTIVFACVVVGDETEETYTWVLQQFLECMSGKKPLSIVTDGDRAMRQAITRIFPDSCHRLCSWHLIRNCTSNISDVNFTSAFKKCMFGDYEVDEFEEKWVNIVEQFGLKGHKWIGEVYEKKHMWATAYLRGEFFVGIRSTSRCEGMNANIKKYIRSSHSLTEFFQLFQKFLEYRRNKELKADFVSCYGEPVLQSPLMPLEKHAANVYTKEALKLFRRELGLVAVTPIVETKDTFMTRTYVVSKYGQRHRKWETVYELRTSKMKCNCGFFESFAIPCSHMICVMVNENLTDIPPSCINRRWTKDAKLLSELPPISDMDENMLSNVRYSSLIQLCRCMCSMASRSKVDFNETRVKLGEIINHLESKSECRTSEFGGQSSAFVHEPTLSKTKGRSKEKSLLSHMKKKRRCGICHNEGHTRRTCHQRGQVETSSNVQHSQGSQGSSENEEVYTQEMDEIIDDYLWGIDEMHHYQGEEDQQDRSNGQDLYGNANVWKTFTDLFDYFPLTALFEPAPRRGEPDVTRRTPDYFL